MNSNETLVQKLSLLIENRRAIYPGAFTSSPIEDEIILDILHKANFAPTHRRTEPWRFKVMKETSLETLGDLLADLYKETSGEQFKEVKFRKTAQKPRSSSHVVAICMQRDPKASVPEWEEVAATAMAVQNMWLMASAYGIGAYWSSPKSIQNERVRALLDLNETEVCLGFFYMGYHQMPQQQAIRTPFEDKVKWI